MQNPAFIATELNAALIEIQKAAAALYLFTDKLTLLKMVHHVVVKIIQAVDLVQKELKQTASREKAFDALESSTSVLFLEEVVDADTMSELEDYILSFAKQLDDEDLIRFLSEIMDKVEIKYNALLEKTHEFNALLKNELE
ncbi:MAG: hypothetical protein WCJ11_02530 [Methylococcaceae bacterium]